MAKAISIGLILLYALLVFNAAALEIDSLKYNSGDTFVARSGEDLISSQASILDNNGNSVKVGLLSYKIENTNYLYFDIPSWMLGNYTLKYQNNNLPFTVSNGEAVTLRPVVLYLEQDVNNARIDLTNKYSNDITVDISSNNTDVIFSRAALTVPVSSSRSFYLSFDPKKIVDSVITLRYGSRSYEVPLVIAKSPPKVNESVSLVVPEEPAAPVIQNTGLALKLVENITLLQHKISKTKMINGSLHFVSNKELKNLQFHLTPGIAEIITLNVTDYPVMAPNREYEVYLWINKYKNFPEGRYSGLLSLDAEDGNTANVSFMIELTGSTLPPVEVPNKTKLNITRPSFNATDITVNFTSVNYTEELRIQNEQSAKNTRLGLLLMGIFLLLGALLVYMFRPKRKELKFNDYVSQFKKGNQKKKP